jgi:hypothetical protein
MILKKIRYIGKKELQCITVQAKDGLYITDDEIISHNSPASVYTQVLGSVSMKKGGELLLDPYLQVLENSDFFQKVRSHDHLIRYDKELKESNTLEHIYWTTATPFSELAMSNKINYKLISSVVSVLGQAQPLTSKVLLPNNTYTTLENIHVGDTIASPIFKETTVLAEFPQGEIDCYKITLSDGRSTECSLNHLWCVAWKKDDEDDWIWKIVDTEFIINHPELEFEIFDDGVF